MLRQILTTIATSVFLLATDSPAEAPFKFEQTPGKLPKDVVPQRYHVFIEPSIEKAAFRGTATIELNVTKPVRQITLNSLGLTIRSARLVGKETTALSPKLDVKEQLLTFDLPSELPAGTAKLELEFDGKLTETTEGLYITRYATKSGDKRALTTQFQATDARRMFPCWDEPAFRARFQLSARIPSKWASSSNMPAEKVVPHDDGTATVVFAESPSMVSYLLAFSAGEFETIEDEVDGIKLRMLTTEGKREQARYALEATKLVLPYFNDYFGVKYPLPQLDQISFASTAASGMENWGSIIYNDMALLYDPGVSPQERKEWVFAVVAHEIAHQWFGDLVTMAWWDNLWLNEGFASWMATKASDHFNPDWKVWLRAAGDKEHAMQLDARATTHPIQQPVKNESQANDAFDVITYQKGQSFLRMLEAWLGEDKFRTGIRAYMKKHQYGNTTTADLWASLAEASGEPVAEVAAGWTEQPGFPMIHVRHAAGGITLSQERFSVQKPPLPPLTWQVPVRYNLEGTPTTGGLLGEEPMLVATKAGDVKVNTGDTGYYRVNYAPEVLAKLLKRIESLPDADRLNLLNDTWAMVQAEHASVTAALELAEKLRDDPSPVIRHAIVGWLGTWDHLTRDTKTQEALRNWSRAFLQPELARCGWTAKPNESPLDGLLRADVIGLLGYIGDDGVKGEARKRYAAFLKDPLTLTGDLREKVLSIVGRDADTETYEQLHSLAKNETSTEQKRFLYAAMAASRDATVARRTLALSLTDELVPKAATGIVLSVGREHPALAWEFAKANLEPLLAKLSSIKANDYVPNLFRPFSDEARADELEAFARESLPPDAGNMVARAADEIRQKAKLKLRILPEIDAWCSRRVAP